MSTLKQSRFQHLGTYCISRKFQLDSPVNERLHESPMSGPISSLLLCVVRQAKQSSTYSSVAASYFLFSIEFFFSPE